MREITLKPGDIVFVHSEGLVAFLIRLVTRRGKEAQTYVNHVALVCDGGPLLEAMIVDAQPPTVAIRPLSAYVGEMVAIYRKRTLTDAMRLRLAARARFFDGKHYGILKILLHLVGLSGLACIDRWPICSYTVAVPYALEGFAFGAVGAKAADPDDIWDWVRAHLDHYGYECIRELSILEGPPVSTLPPMEALLP